MAIPILDDPIELFRIWLEQARETGMKEPTAMSLATAGLDGMPSARIVLLKDVSKEGFTFYTNLESEKGAHLAANARAALCFHWMELEKQVRIQGTVSQVSDEVADAYFATRDRNSRIGAWASKQSRPLKSRFELEKRAAKYTAKFALRPVPRPPYWSGFLVSPIKIEFWEARAFRLHERLLYARVKDGWQTSRLFP